MGKQSKWQAIMELEMQDPNNMITFSIKDLVWSEINQTNGSFDRVAKISSHRVLNFIRGDEMDPNVACGFIQRKTKEPRKKDTASLGYEV